MRNELSMWQQWSHGNMLGESAILPMKYIATTTTTTTIELKQSNRATCMHCVRTYRSELNTVHNCKYGQ